MTTITCVLWLTRSRKLVHVVGVEILRDGQAELRYTHDQALCGVRVRSEPEDIDLWDIDLSQATCPRCDSRADALTYQ